MSAELQPPLTLGALQLRLVSEADFPFMRALYRVVRSNELSVTNWTQAVKDQFCDTQFAQQDQYYRANYPHARFFIIEHNAQRVGRLYLSDEPDLLALMDISLIESQRGQGHGTAIMQWLTALADRTQRVMRLYVETDNPALRLYERFGFQPNDRHGVYIKMLRSPAMAATTESPTAASSASLSRD